MYYQPIYIYIFQNTKSILDYSLNFRKNNTEYLIYTIKIFV